MRPSKRDQLVEKALKVFYQNGFNASGMDLIASETGVSKTSIYKHFRTKDDLIVAALNLRDAQFTDWLCKRMAEIGGSPAEQLIALFDALEEWFNDPEFKSCMFIKASSEFQDKDHPAYQVSTRHKQNLEQYVTDLAKKAGMENPSAIARQLLLLKEGAIVSAHMGTTEAPAKDAKQAALALINR